MRDDGGFEIGDLVKVIDDNEGYRFCIGAVGRIISSPTRNTHHVKFSKEFPMGVDSVDPYTRVFYSIELEIADNEKFNSIIDKYYENH